MKHKKTITFIIILAILIIVYLITNYRYLNSSQNKVDNEYSDLSIAIDKKLEIAKNINTELKNMKYISELSGKYKTTCKNLEDAYNIETKNKYNKELDEYVVLIENDLDSKKIIKSENYKSLITQYNTQNNKIEESVKRYNKSVNNYNNKLSIIPNNITSKLFGMKLEKNYD